MGESSLKLLTDVLGSSADSTADSDMLEGMESNYESESEDELAELNFELVGEKRSFNASVDDDIENISEEESEIFLDDADENELAAFDAKLSEIFRLKKEKSSSLKLSAEALLHFKARILHWIRFLLHHRTNLSLKLQVYLAIELLKTMSVCMKDQSPSICDSILKILKGLGKPEKENRDVIWNPYLCSAVDLIVDSYWEHQILWTAAYSFISWAFRISGENFSCHLVSMWNFLVKSKTAQKSRFASLFTLIATQFSEDYLTFMESSDFFEKLPRINMHCRLILLQSLQTAIAHSSLERNWEAMRLGWTAYLTDFLSSPELDTKSNSWRAHLSTFNYLKKKIGPISLELKPSSTGRLDKASAT